MATTKNRIEIINNGNCWADHLDNEGLLKNGQTVDEIAKICETISPNASFLKQDSFWEDFCYRAEELGYSLKY